MGLYPDEDYFKWLIRRLKSSNITYQGDAAEKLLRMARTELPSDAAEALMTRIATQGAIPFIVKMFRSEEQDLQARAASLLAGMAMNLDGFDEEMVGCGAVEELVVVLNSRSATTRNAALAALANIACSPAGAERAFQAGVVGVLLEQFLEWQGARSRSLQLQLLLGALSNLAFNKGCALEIAFSGAFLPLFLHSRQQEPFSSSLLVLLGRLGFFEECHQRLIDVDALEWVVTEAARAREQLLDKEPQSPTSAKLRVLDADFADEAPLAALEALAGWSKSIGDELRQQLVWRGALHLAVELLYMDAMDGQDDGLLPHTLAAAELLVGLAPAAAEAVQVDSVLCAELVTAIFRGLGSGFPELQEAMALALQNLLAGCRVPCGPSQLVRELHGAVDCADTYQLLLQLLESENLQQQCSGLIVLRAFAMAGDGIAGWMLKQQKVLTKLQVLAKHPDPCCREVAIQAMNALSATTASAAHVKGDHVAHKSCSIM